MSMGGVRKSSTLLSIKGLAAATTTVAAARSKHYIITIRLKDLFSAGLGALPQDVCIDLVF